MTTALDWRSLPGATHLEETDRNVLYLREQGHGPAEIGPLLQIPVPSVKHVLNRAARKLGHSTLISLVDACGWPRLYAKAGASASHPGKEPVMAERKREREERREVLSPGVAVHFHTAFGLHRGTVTAFGSGMVLLADGSEVQRSRVHVGEDCAA